VATSGTVEQCHESSINSDPTALLVTILIPVFNDWPVVDVLLHRLDETCVKSRLHPNVVLVNDGSTQEPEPDFLVWRPQALSLIEVLDLYTNLGHQRALCVGVYYIQQQDSARAILIMDADGEDSPQDVGLLFKKYREENGQKAVFAQRGRRMENLLFKLFYQFYRGIHFVLVGFDIRIGNFSILPPSTAAALLRCSDFWNHYAASVIKLKLPMSTVKVDRAKRLKGKSQMSFTRLIIHGLGALSVYNDTIAARVLMFATSILGFSAMLFATAWGFRFWTKLAIPGWATTVTGLLCVFVLQIITIALLFSFGVLASRGMQPFVPMRDCGAFILGAREPGHNG
jgi:glycosyltransferase involved in cell wall biosynthesis